MSTSFLINSNMLYLILILIKYETKIKSKNLKKKNVNLKNKWENGCVWENHLQNFKNSSSFLSSGNMLSPKITKPRYTWFPSYPIENSHPWPKSLISMANVAINTIYSLQIVVVQPRQLATAAYVHCFSSCSTPSSSI